MAYTNFTSTGGVVNVNNGTGTFNNVQGNIKYNRYVHGADTTWFVPTLSSKPPDSVENGTTKAFADNTKNSEGSLGTEGKLAKESDGSVSWEHPVGPKITRGTDGSLQIHYPGGRVMWISADGRSSTSRTISPNNVFPSNHNGPYAPQMGTRGISTFTQDLFARAGEFYD